MYAWFCLLSVVAGTLIPLQAGLNAQLKLRLDNPYYATLISVTVSLAAMGLFCLVARIPPPALTPMAAIPLWVWSGGVVGVVYLFMVLLLAPKLGATALIASIIGGQLFCSLVMDQWGLVGFAQHPLNAGRCLGLVLLFAGVFLIQKY